MPLSESLELVSIAFSWSLIKFKSTPEPGKKMVGYCWESDGGGSYEIEEVDGQRRGTKIVIHLKEDSSILPDRIKDIVKKYSAFVQFPSPLTEESEYNRCNLVTLEK